MSNENRQPPIENVEIAYDELTQKLRFLKGAPIFYFPSCQELSNSSDDHMLSMLRLYPTAILIIEGDYEGDKRYPDIQCGLLIRSGRGNIGMIASYEVNTTVKESESPLAEKFNDDFVRQIYSIGNVLLNASREIATNRIQEAAGQEGLAEFTRRKESGRVLCSYNQAIIYNPLMYDLPMGGPIQVYPRKIAQ